MKDYRNDLTGDIVKALDKYAERPAFVINDTTYTLSLIHI